MINIQSLVRKNIAELKPYSSARDEFSGEALMWLDANENPNDTLYNRYPDPKQNKLKQCISEFRNVSADQIFIGNGSDEAIDLLFRAFCEPNIDKAYVFNPTYGMYNVSAGINQVELVDLGLENGFEWPSVESIKSKVTSKGLLFICSPNNPTGNSCALEYIQDIANWFQGIVIVDEAYIDFSNSPSAINLLETIPNLVVLQTFSKAYGLAGLRLGMAFGSREVIDVLNTIKPPYNINTVSQKLGVEVLQDLSQVIQGIEEIKQERENLKAELERLEKVLKVYPSDANFLLVEFTDADNVYEYLMSKGIIVRNRNSQIKNTIRISIGTPEQNKTVLNILKTWS